MQKKLLCLETLFYLFLVCGWYLYQYSCWQRDYLDADNYFHALRLIDFFNTPHFYETVFIHSNYPFGEILHWTWAFDLIWGVLALPFLIVYPIKTAVFYSGLLVAPICLIGATYYFLKAGRFIMAWPYRLLVLIILASQSNFMRVVALNRPDHHVLFVLLQAAVLYNLLKFVRDRENRNLIFLGIITAFSLWAAAEGIFLFLGVFAFLIYGYLFLSYKYAYFLNFLTAYAVSLGIFLLLNPPYQGILFIDNGRLSVFYVMAAFIVTATMFCLKNVRSKIHQMLLLLAVSLGIILVYYHNNWLISPLNERLNIPFVFRITEMENGNSYTLAYPLVAFVLGGLLLKHKIRDEAYIFLYLNLCFYTFLTCFAMRFVPYAGVYAAFILALFVAEKFKSGKEPIGLIIFLVFLEYISFILHIICSYSLDDLTQKIDVPVLNVPQQVLEKLPKGTFATDVFMAPYVIWFGGHNVIASPYHRNVEGILDNHDIFFSANEEKVKELLKKHKVNYVLLFKNLDADYYQKPEENCDKLYGKILACHNYPKWLKPMYLESEYFLFEVGDLQ